MGKRACKAASLCLSALFCLLPAAAAFEDLPAALKAATQAAKQAYLDHDYQGAIAKYQQALNLAKGASPKVFVILYSNLGAALREAHRFVDAQGSFQSALSFAERNNLEHDASARNCMRQYATLLRRMGNNVDAELMQARADGTALVARTNGSGAVAPADDSADLPNVTIDAPVVDVAPKAAQTTDDIKQMLVDRPRDLNLWVTLAQKYMAQSQWAQAISTWQTIGNDFPNQVKNLHQHLAYCYQQSGDINNAISQMQTQIADKPGESRSYLVLHQLYVDNGDLKSALETDRAYLEKFSDTDQYHQTVLNLYNSLTTQGGTPGDKPNAIEQKENWPDYYFPLKVWAAPVPESYHFSRSTTAMSDQSPSEVLTDALDCWTRVSQQRVTFACVQRPEDANIEISFTNNPNGLEPGRAGVTQWGQREEHQKVRITILLVNADTGKPVTPELLMSTVLHELGHALGLQHSSLVDDIMYPQLHGEPQVTLSANDAKRVIKLYTR